MTRLSRLVQNTRFPTLVWLLQLGLTTVTIFLFHRLIPPGPHGISEWTKTFGGWDGGTYLKIAEHGYRNIQSTAFFPIYPILIRTLHTILHLTYLRSGILLSNLSYLVALILMYRMFVHHFGSNTARRALWLLSCFPVAFFFNVVYTESLTLMLYVIFFYLLEREHWWGALIVGFLATGVHDLNVLLVIPAGVYWWVYIRPVPTSKPFLRLTGMALIPLSLVIYMLFLYIHFGHPLAFLIAESYWGRHFSIPVLNVVYRLFTLHYGETARWNYNVVAIVNAGATLLFDALAVKLLVDRDTNWRARLFVLGTLLASTTSTTYTGIESYARFVMVLFPGYPVLAKSCRRKATFAAVILLFICLRILLAGLFGDGYVVT